jgi:phosphotransferase family enzyme
MPVTVDELRRAIEGATGRRVASLDRRSSAYRTSFPIEEVDARLDDGTQHALMLKDLGLEAVPDPVRRAKPAFLLDPRREVEVYTQVLADAGLGTARCYAAVADRRGRRSWLLLERVPGVELYQVGDLDVWRSVARWLAAMHAQLRDARTPRLLHHDRRLLACWIDRAVEIAGHAGGDLAALASSYGAVVDRLAALPAGFIHGELYASNVLVVDGEGGLRRICPVDWELAAVGPLLLDLAALTVGRGFGERERRSIAYAYLEAASWPGSCEEAERDLECCRLHVAVQWLGWSRDWTPPEEHAQDWLAEARRSAARLGLEGATPTRARGRRS